MKKSKLKSTITKELKNKTVLITGGAGSIGAAITLRLIKYPVRSIRVLDIDEHALFKLKRKVNDQRIRFLLGSVLDRENRNGRKQSRHNYSYSCCKKY